LVKDIYRQALEQVEELRVPYASVIDIQAERLPFWRDVQRWSAPEFVAALRHEPKHPAYNPHLRQLLHVGYKIAARMGERYFEALASHQATVARNVTANLFERHIRPLFL